MSAITCFWAIVQKMDAAFPPLHGKGWGTRPFFQGLSLRSPVALLLPQGLTEELRRPALFLSREAKAGIQGEISGAPVVSPTNVDLV